MKKNDIALFIIGILYGIVGIIFLTVPAEDIFNFVFIVLGVLLILFNSLVIIESIPKIKQDKAYIVVLIIAIIQVIMGIFVIVTESKLLLVITGSLLIAFPLLSVLSAKDKKEQLKLEITKIALGLIFIILGATNAAKYVFIALGVLSLIFGAMYLLIALLMSFVKDEIESNEDALYKNGRINTSYTSPNNEKK